MKKLAFAMLLLSSTLAFAATPKAVPMHPLVTVQVVFSRYIIAPGRATNYQQLDAVVDGQQVELYSDEACGVLAPGDYKAQPISTYNGAKGIHDYIPRQPNGFDLFVIYRFQLPDGSTRDYKLIGLGPKAPYATTPPPSPHP
jgi:hypothetical protein